MIQYENAPRNKKNKTFLAIKIWCNTQPHTYVIRVSKALIVLIIFVSLYPTIPGYALVLYVCVQKTKDRLRHTIKIII